MTHFSKCPHGNKCLILQTDADRNCAICKLCREGNPQEYAVHIKQTDGLSKILRFIDLPQVTLDTIIEQVSIYRLAGSKYYSKEAICFKPESNEVKQELFAQVQAW